jgi:uncharacterized membrane-anchored protein YjiN (DUF445 family)
LRQKGFQECRNLLEQIVERKENSGLDFRRPFCDDTDERSSDLGDERLQGFGVGTVNNICIALKELIGAASPEQLEDYEATLVSVVRSALVDPNTEVREAAAEAFDSLQEVLGKKAIDHVLPNLLHLLRDEDEAQNALSALLTLLTDNARSNIILPNLLPTLLKSPMSAFNARAIASLAEVASGAMTRRLPNVLNTIMDNIITCKNDELRSELETAFDSVLLSVDEYDGLNTAMSVMLALAKHDDERRRARADMHLAKFFEETENDFSRYYPNLISALLISFDDGDKEVVSITFFLVRVHASGGVLHDWGACSR